MLGRYLIFVCLFGIVAGLDPRPNNNAANPISMSIKNPMTTSFRSTKSMLKKSHLKKSHATLPPDPQQQTKGGTVGRDISGCAPGCDWTNSVNFNNRYSYNILTINMHTQQLLYIDIISYCFILFSLISSSLFVFTVQMLR